MTTKLSADKKKDGAGYWKAAVDPKSGRAYYYNSKTRETSWNKPFELASLAEQHEMVMKREEASKFFADMENNIKKKFSPRNAVAATSSSGNVDASSILFNGYGLEWNGDVMFAGDTAKANSLDYLVSSEPFKDRPYSLRGRLPSSSLASTTAPRMIRTISTIDDDILEILKYDERKQSGSLGKSSGLISRQGSDDRSISPQNDTARRMGHFPNTLSDSPLLGHSPFGMPATSYLSVKEVKDLKGNNASVIKSNPREALKRRNSTGTIYIGTTMSVQDNEATIKCVCFVFRAHIIEAVKRNATASRQFDIFKDSPNTSRQNGQTQTIPSFNEIKDFFMLIFSKSQLESECIIMALIYCERMIKETQGRFVVQPDNWKSILFACLVMASKVWDDLSMWNVDFSQISDHFKLHRVNALELAVLEALDYIIRVPASEYAKYYFHCRSMMARLGFHDHEPNFIAPLDLNGARRLQLATERYQEDRQTVRQVQSMRLDSSSLSSESPVVRLERHVSADGIEMEKRLRRHSVAVGLEQLVHSEHNDADGSAHTSAKNTPRSNASPSTRFELPLSPRAPISPVAKWSPVG